MPNSKKIYVCFALLIFCCAGCSSLLQHDFLDPTIFGHASPGVYRGVRLDANYIFRPKHTIGPQPPDPNSPVTPTGEILAMSYGIIDFPFSLTADTLIFPYDLITLHGKPDWTLPGTPKG